MDAGELGHLLIALELEEELGHTRTSEESGKLQNINLIRIQGELERYVLVRQIIHRNERLGKHLLQQIN